MTDPIEAAALAQLFHETYECLAPKFNYRTREASAVPWADVPEQNKALMIATCAEVLDALLPPGVLTVWDRRDGTDRQPRLVAIDQWERDAPPLYRLEPQP